MAQTTRRTHSLFSIADLRGRKREELNQKSKEKQNKDTKECFCYQRDERKGGQKRPRARLDRATLLNKKSMFDIFDCKIMDP